MEKGNPTVETVVKLSLTMNREQIEDAIKSWVIKNHQQFRNAVFDLEDITDDDIVVRAEKKK